MVARAITTPANPPISTTVTATTDAAALARR
jgi:hypothetical protein